MTENLDIGQTVELADGRTARIRFVGSTLFASGEWIGVELDEQTGKNNGSVQGHRYFECKAGYGMFLRRTGVAHVLEEPTPKPRMPDKAEQQTGKARLSTALGSVQRFGEGVDAARKRQTLNVDSPTPGARRQSGTAASRSPSKSPTKQLASPGPSSSSASRTSTPSVYARKATPITVTRARADVRARPSLAATPSAQGVGRAPRLSLLPPNTASRAHPSAPIKRSSISSNVATHEKDQEREAKRVWSVSNTSRANDADFDTSRIEEESETQLRQSRPTTPVNEGAPEAPSTAGPSSSEHGPAARSPSLASSQSKRLFSNSLAPPLVARDASGREVERLRTVVKVLEKKRLEDREKLKAMDKSQQECGRLEGIIQKLDGKCRSQQQELVNLRQELRELQTILCQPEAAQAEHDSMLEMATLDREMAEETAEALKTELETLKPRLEELELEVEVLKEEIRELGQEMSPEERSSQGWLQMERSNERLREALLRLRDVAQQQEADLKGQVGSLEQDVEKLKRFEQQFEQKKASLLKSEAIAEDLRQQLDASLGAEEIIEELTEKNLALSENLNEMRAVVDELENLKELNDELEVNHVENEKQMQEEIDHKNSIIAEQKLFATRQNEALEDRDLTIGRFRELLRNLHNDFQDMKASQQITESEAEQLTNKSRAMMDLNLKLQASAAKTQVKAIDLELRKLEAQEAVEHLAIIQMYLPQDYNSDKDSVLALLRFKRVAFKAQLLHDFIKERIADRSHITFEEDMFEAFKILDQLTCIFAMCERFVNYIRGCSVEGFAKFGGVSYELEPVERALNRHIESLKKDKLKLAPVAEELQRSIALLEHLGDVHMQRSVEGYAYEVLMHVQLMQSHLENTAAALSLSQGFVKSEMVPEAEVQVEEFTQFVRKTDIIISQARSAKVLVCKTLSAIDELRARSLSLNMSTSQSFSVCQHASAQLASRAREIGTNLATVLFEEGRQSAVSWRDIAAVLEKEETSSPRDSATSNFSELDTAVRSLTNALHDLHNSASNLDATVEFERSPQPWQLRSQEILSSKIVSADAQNELERLRSEVQDRISQCRLRERVLDEANVKIEMLESRMGDAAKRSSKLAALEQALQEMEKKERDNFQEKEAHVRSLEDLETDRDRWKKAAEENAASSAALATGHGSPGQLLTATEKRRTDAEIDGLQNAVRFLRVDNARLRFGEDSAALAWLHTPLVRQKNEARERRKRLESEGKEALYGLLALVRSARAVDLSTLPQDKLAWRPARTRPRAQVLTQVEEYEAWVARVADVVGRGEGGGRGRKERAGAAPRARDRRGDVLGPAWEKVGHREEVRIVEPDSYG